MGPIDFNGLDTTVHGPLRLGVLTALQLDGPHDFTTLKKRLEVQDGSLGLQLQKLEEAEYIGAEVTADLQVGICTLDRAPWSVRDQPSGSHWGQHGEVAAKRPHARRESVMPPRTSSC
jgi:hypothetical protein